MSIKELINYFKNAPIEEITKKLKGNEIEFVYDPEATIPELENLTNLLKELRKQIEEQRVTSKEEEKITVKDDIIKLRTTTEEKNKLKKYCKENDIDSISELIRISLKYYMERNEEKDGKK